MTESTVEPPVLDYICGFCSRSVYTDGTINMGCGYCSRKTRAEIERELRPFQPLAFVDDPLAYYERVGPERAGL